MSDNIRPDVTVFQRFVTPAPLVLSTPLNVLYFGIQRQQVWQGEAGDYVGGQANPAYDFPELDAGAKVEQPSASDEVLRPHVYIRNRFGVAEVPPSYNWAVNPPVFSLSPALTAVFEVSEGTTGDYASSTGLFLDANADFIEDEVAATDIIKIDGIPAFSVVSLISDGELEVTKIDKGPGTYSGDLSAVDLNGDRTLTDSVFDFSAVARTGDLITVKGWDLISQADGIDYSAEVAGIRTIVGSTYDFAGAGVQPPIVGPPYQVDVVWVKDNEGDWVPAFKVASAVGTTSLNAVNLITAPAWPAAGAAEINKVFEIFHYTSVDLTGGGVWTDVNGDWTSDGTPIAGQRTFTIGGGNPNGIDFSALLVLPLSRYSLTVHGINAAGGTANARPIFKIVSIVGFPAPSTTLIVENWDPDRPALSATGTGTTWEVWDDGGAAVLSFLGASVTAVDPLDLNKRTLTSTYNDFVAEGVAPGDIVYSDTGLALFLVTDVGAPLPVTQIKCINIDPLFPAPGSAISDFGFAIMADTEATLRVTRIISENVIGVRNLLSDPPATMFLDLHYKVEAASTLSDIDYTIAKTLTGSTLEGTVLCSYMARRNDRLGKPISVASDDREELVGLANPANPLGLGAYLGLLNTPYTVWCAQVEDDTAAAWIKALEGAKTTTFYALCPLTQNETVLAAYQGHTLLQSEPNIKRERILFQNHKFERIETRTTDQPGDSAVYTKTLTTTTITVARDLSAYDVIVGDVFRGLAPEFSARIITIVSGATTTLTVVNANGLPVGGPTTILDWAITSKALTDAEFAVKIGDYATSIKSRRIRNVYPDTCEITFTDDTDISGVSGFYGGGDVTKEVGGHFLAAVPAAQRSGQRPGQPLSRYSGYGIHKLINPFGDPEGGDEDKNDVILNGGNWLMSQPSDDAGVFAIRAITTDVSDIYFLEDHVTVQIDAFSFALRRQIKPLLGPFNIEESFFDIVSANVEAVRITTLDEKNAREIEFLSIREDETQDDQFLIDFNFRPFVTGAKAKVTIYI